LPQISIFQKIAATPADDDLLAHDIWVLLLRALLARARGDEADLVGRYRAMAASLGFEGHIALAEAMP
jgi:hypothetical protein